MNILKNWQPASDCAYNLKDEVHVWKLPLNLSSEQIKYLRSVLNSDEVKRADRFYFDKDRNRFTAARGQMRILLAEYTNQKIQDINFKYGEHGKPFLPDSELEFNISHSNNLGLFAVNLKTPIGVDIEWKRPDFGGLKIAQRFFSPKEVSELENLPQEKQLQAFFNGWSRKEAYIKARGKGLAIPLAKFSVTLVEDKNAELYETLDAPEAHKNLKLYAVDADPAYTAAVVANYLKTDFHLFSVDEKNIDTFIQSNHF